MILILSVDATPPQALLQLLRQCASYFHLTLCYGLFCVPLPKPNPYVATLMPKGMVLGGGTFGRCLGPEYGALMNGISALLKLYPFQHVRTLQESASSEPGNGPSPRDLGLPSLPSCER